VPTRELGIQVASDLQKTGRVRGVRVLCVYGGRAYEPQVDALQKGIEVVVGTPGRLIDLARQGHLDLKHVQTLVLDEADEMLDMGFLPDVERIVALTPASRQTMLFSATMPGQIVALARRYMTQPTHIRALDPHDDNATVDAIEQHVWRAHSLDKQELIARALQADGRGLTIIFCRTKRNAQRVSDDLVDRGFARPRCTATSARARASRRCARSATARSTSSWRPTSPPAASTSTTSPTSSTGSARTTTRPTCTASAAPAARATRASRSRWSTGTTCTSGR
jgi:superfamily II DNA/RNA helicase